MLAAQSTESSAALAERVPSAALPAPRAPAACRAAVSLELPYVATGLGELTRWRQALKRAVLS